jgi:hypothetical protein
MKENEYECGICHEIYIKGWSDKDALCEAVDNFGFEEFNKGDNVIICDDCYEQIKPFIPEFNIEKQIKDILE